MRLNGNSNEPDPPSLKWLEKHHPGRAIDLDERDFVEEVWNASRLAQSAIAGGADYCIHHEDDDEKPLMVNIADTEKDPKAVTLRCPQCGWIPVELAS